MFGHSHSDTIMTLLATIAHLDYRLQHPIFDNQPKEMPQCEPMHIHSKCLMCQDSLVHNGSGDLEWASHSWTIVCFILLGRMLLLEELFLYIVNATEGKEGRRAEGRRGEGRRGEGRGGEGRGGEGRGGERVREERGGVGEKRGGKGSKGEERRGEERGGEWRG